MAKRLTRLERDYRYCEEVIRKNSKSFYYAFLRLPKEKANAVFAIYAFCRLADDSVDLGGTKEEKLKALRQLKEELKLFERGEEPDSPLWRALRDVFDRYEMNIAPFFDQLIGQEMDVDFSVPKTMGNVEEYSYYVAGSVGLMLLPILASEAVMDLKEKAVSLGVAMQITNILRDVGEDYQDNGRIYLPESELELVSYSEADLREGRINPGFISVWEKMASRAEELYKDFQEGIDYFDADSRYQVLLSARIYRGILDAVRQNGYDCFKKRNFVSAVEMQRIQLATKVLNL